LISRWPEEGFAAGVLSVLSVIVHKRSPIATGDVTGVIPPISVAHQRTPEFRSGAMGRFAPIPHICAMDPAR